MLLEELENLTSKYPDLEDHASTIRSLIEKNSEKVYQLRFSLERLLEKLNLPVNFESLQIVEILISNNILDKQLLIESALGGGLQTFSSIQEIPDTIYDQYQGTNVQITPDNIKTIFTIHKF